MRRSVRCKKCGYNYLTQVRFGAEPADANQKPPEQKCPKCGETT